MSGNRIIYNPTFKATEETLEQVTKEFEEALERAPKPNKFKDETIVVAPKLEFTGKKIKLTELLKEFGNFSDSDNDEGSSDKKNQEGVPPTNKRGMTN